MHALLIAIGSHGDVHPFVGLGLELRRRGHRVTVVANPHFQGLIERVGLGFVPLDTDERFREMLKNPDVWHPIKGFATIMRRGVLTLMRPVYEIIQSLNVPRGTFVAASSLAFGARLAEEKLGVPTATVHVAPAVFRSSYDPPKLPGLPMPPWMPVGMKDALWWLADKLVIDPIVLPELNGYRRELGLPPVKRALHDWWHSPRRVIGMFPEWFSPAAPDWPRQVRLVGFPLYDERDVEPLSPEMQFFLDAGDAPIAFTPGSANLHGRAFFQTAVETCRALNRRGILLTRHREQVPAHLPSAVRHFSYAPFSQLLPKCAALVHHGGIGTTSQALAAGVPQVIVPMSYDQFDNARRVERLNVGEGTSQGGMAQALGRLLGSSNVASACRNVAGRFDHVDALAAACEQLEELMEQADAGAGIAAKDEP